MAVDTDLLRRFRDAEQRRRMEGVASSDDSWQALSSIPEVLAYLVHQARSWGCSEDEAADLVELTVMDIDFYRDELRAFARLLGALGYDVVSDRLEQLAKACKCRPRRPGRRRSKPARAAASPKAKPEMAVALFRPGKTPSRAL